MWLPEIERESKRGSNSLFCSIMIGVLISFLCTACGLSTSSNNEVKWKVKPTVTSDQITIRTPVAVADNTIYVISAELYPIEQLKEEHFLQALDAETGKQKWKFQIPGYSESAPIVENGTVYFGTDAWTSGHIYAIDAKNGQQKWVIDIEGHHKISPVVVVDEIVYVSYWLDSSPRGGHILAIDANLGKLIWKQSVIQALSGSLTLEAETLFFSGDDYVFAVDRHTGKELWKFESRRSTFGPPLAVNGKVYVASEKNLYMLDGLTGTEKWRFPVEPGAPQTPVAANDRIYFFQLSGDPRVKFSSHLYAIDTETQEQKWHQEIEGGVNTPPTLNKNTMYLTIFDGILSAIDTTTGTELWRFTTDEPTISAPPILVNEILYVGNWEGYLYAIPVR